MPKFIVRVELHDVPADYDKLHTAMEASGFTRTYTSEDSQVKMPSGVYRMVAEKTLDQVIDLANNAAMTIKPKVTVLAIEYTKLTQRGSQFLP
jgi:hypothetical protein